jgi:hypothetical protein
MWHLQQQHHTSGEQLYHGDKRKAELRSGEEGNPVYCQLLFWNLQKPRKISTSIIVSKLFGQLTYQIFVLYLLCQSSSIKERQ